MKQTRFLTRLTYGAALILSGAFPFFAFAAPSQEAPTVKPLVLAYSKPAPLGAKGWENESLPLGNGFFGVNLFGGLEEECLTFAEKSFYMRHAAKPDAAYDKIGFSTLCEIRLLQDHKDGVTQYRRELDLRRALSTVRYQKDGVTYTREAFASYPDRCFAMRLTASQKGKISFRLKAILPFLGTYRTGSIQAEGNTLRMSGSTEPFGLKYEARLQIVAKGGLVKAATIGDAKEPCLDVNGAEEVLIVMALDTNYKLEKRIFLESGKKKLEGNPDPAPGVEGALAKAVSLGWAALLERHEKDYRSLFDRVDLDLGGTPSRADTDAMLRTPQSPGESRMLEETYFQFGRYLLIASSREGTLPANLQGTWNTHECAPWTGGYWMNINLQMNYWPAFLTHLEETFPPFLEFLKASYEKNCQTALNQVKRHRPDNLADDCGWTAGTGNGSFSTGGPGTTSGFGTGPFVMQNLWDWYEFTGDKEVLRKIWPFLVSSSRFTSKILKKEGDVWLCDPSWSPENQYVKGDDKGKHVQLPGTAYDQQLIYEGHQMTLRAAEILGENDPCLSLLKEQLGHLEPVLIGESGQIKEFRQESKYAEFGDPRHRHISQLVGLYPGKLINSTQPAWLAAAKATLTLRGDKSTGWAMAHRLNAWARTKDGPHTFKLLRNLLEKGTMNNLWDTHPPFQIDGNFGGTAGIAEMLLQSHEGAIELLPAFPVEWNAGSFCGLRARGNFEVSASWAKDQLVSLSILSRGGMECRIKTADPQKVSVTDPAGNAVKTSWKKGVDVVAFPTSKGGLYQVRGVTVAPRAVVVEPPPPPPIRAGTNGEFRLLAETSNYGDLLLEPKGPGGAFNIGGWISADATLSWSIQIDMPGEYLVDIYAAGSSAALFVRAGELSVDAKLHGTKGFGDFQWQRLAKITLVKGVQKLTLKPNKDGSWHPINLAEIKLIPSQGQ